MAAVNRFMNTYFGVYAPGMYDELTRRYPKISKQLINLEEKGKISTTDPRKLTEEDIKEFIIYQRSRGLQDTSISHDLSAIKSLCMYISGNNCVDIARAKYPLLFKKKRHIRLPVTERVDFQKLVEFSHTLSPSSPFRLVRACAESMFAYGSGSRTQEIQFAKAKYLDANLKYIFFDHVKGMHTYGETRTAPIRPEARYILEVYLSVRDPQSEYLFHNNKGESLATNTLGNDRQMIVKATGVEFDYRTSRRTYAQYLIDEGVSIELVAVILGHVSSKTTEMSYARPRDDRVVRHVIDLWDKTEGTEVSS
jgi:Site-specific recombinase XerD